MGCQLYHGFVGGLYENGTNSVPADHHQAGLARAGAITPLDAVGTSSAAGKIVFLSIGMSNASAEWRGSLGHDHPSEESFMGQAARHPCVNHSTLVIVDGAQRRQDAAGWLSPTAATYDVVAGRLSAAGVTEHQVQAVWLKSINARPTVALPSRSADVYQNEAHLAKTVRAIRARYPRVQAVFLSSRTYAGYARTALHPEPYAYESGFAVKWLIQAQIDQMRNSGAVLDANLGDLNYTTVAPWLAWAAYTWADGMTPRSDGLSWQASDFSWDGVHPSRAGIEKVASTLMSSFLESPFATGWFRRRS